MRISLFFPHILEDYVTTQILKKKINFFFWFLIILKLVYISRVWFPPNKKVSSKLSQEKKKKI